MTGERKRRDGETQRDIFRVAAALVSRRVLSQGLYKRGSNDKRFMCEKEDFLWEKSVTLLSNLSSLLRSRRRRRKRVEIQRVQSNAGKRELPKFASSPTRLKESLCLSASVFKVVHQVLMNRCSWSEKETRDVNHPCFPGVTELRRTRQPRKMFLLYLFRIWTFLSGNYLIPLRVLDTWSGVCIVSAGISLLNSKQMSVQVGKNKCASVNRRRKFHIFGKYVYLLCTSVRFITLKHVSHQLQEVYVNFFSQICHFSDLMLSGGVLHWLKMLQNMQGSNIHIFTASKFDVSAWLCCIIGVWRRFYHATIAVTAHKSSRFTSRCRVYHQNSFRWRHRHIVCVLTDFSSVSFSQFWGTVFTPLSLDTGGLQTKAFGFSISRWNNL